MPELNIADGDSSESSTESMDLRCLCEEMGEILERIAMVETLASELKAASVLHGEQSSDHWRTTRKLNCTGDGRPSLEIAGLARLNDDQPLEKCSLHSGVLGGAPHQGVNGALEGVCADGVDPCAVEDAKAISSHVSSYRDTRHDWRPECRDKQETGVGSGGTGAHDSSEDHDRLAECLPHSVYVWACGEKQHPGDEDVNVTDVMIGWLTLAGQMMAYAVLILYAETNEGASYSMYSVFLAMFLLVSTSASDIRAGYMLLFRGSSHAQRIFGGLLLVSAALLVIASLRVLFMEAENNAELVIGATTVLFIEDVDNKLMRFMVAIPQEWRFFWMLEAMGISFWLAFVGIKYLVDSEVVSPASNNTSMEVDDFFSTSFVLVYTPGALTMWTLAMNFAVIKAAEAYRGSKAVIRRSRSLQPRGRRPIGLVQPRVLTGEGSFVLALLIWLIVSGMLSGKLAWNMSRLSPDDVRDLWTPAPGIDGVVIGCTYVVALCTTVGLIRAVLGSVCRRVSNGSKGRWYPLFVGWGVGSVVGVLFSNCNVQGTACSRWVPWVCSLLVFSSSVFLFAEVDFLGTWVGMWIEPLVGVLRRGDGYVHWSVVCSAYFLMIWWVVRIYSSAWFEIFA